MKSAVLVTTGPDHPGIMDEIAQFLTERGVSIHDSRSINLRGRFALLLHIVGTEEAMARVQGDLSELCTKQQIGAEITDASSGPDLSHVPYRFVAHGEDRVGVTQKISHLMRVLHINIDQLDVQVNDRAEDGPRFRMQMDLAIPRTTPVMMVREYLETLCKELDISWVLSPV
jgi:glycine cleavage system regulatory protein